MDGKIKVTKIGNKLGFVLPEEIAQKMKISENEEVEYKLVGRRIVLNWSTKAGQSATNYIKKRYISIAIMVSLFRVGLFWWSGKQQRSFQNYGSKSSVCP